MSLRIHTLGPFRVYHDDTPIPEAAWKTQKNRALLKILITYRRRALTKDQLIDWLWRDLSPDAAGRNLRVAVSQLRRVLEPDLPPRAKSSFILTTDAGYAWNTKADYWLDAQEFEGLADSRWQIADGRWQIADGRWQIADGDHQPSAISDLPSAISHMQSAISLYRGDYLEEDRYADWATAERERLRELYFTLLTRLAEVHARRGRYRRAVALCRDVLAADRCRESVWCQLMLYHYHAGDQALALRAYEECLHALAEELGVDPMPTTAALAEQIRQRAVAGEQTYPLPVAIERMRQLPVSLGRMPFVGRDQEFARLAGHWKAAQCGRGHVVIIQGEAGLGKTRLAQELLDVARQQGTWVLQGKARELEGVLPYQPLIDALRSAGDIQRDPLENLDVVWRVELSRLLPEWSPSGAASPPAGQTSGRVFEALTRYLITLAQSQARPKGLILFVDDLHWADQTTVEFLEYLGSRIATQPIMLLGAMRPEEVEPRAPLRQCLHELRRAGRLQLIDLQPLTREAVSRLVQEASQDSPVAQQISRQLYWESQGHPLFMVALLQAFFEEGVFFVDKRGRWGCDEDCFVETQGDLAIPRLVTDVIQRRVQRMDVRAQRLLALCAVVGRPFDFALLHRASGQDEEPLLDALEQALEHRLLQATDEPLGRKYDLSHDLVRRTLYQTLSPDRRALLHRKVLAALESTQPASGETLVGELAHHAIQGQVWARALDYCKRAADVAVGRYALHEALKQCERGLAALDALEREGGSLDPRHLLTWRYDLLAIRQLAAHLLGQREPAVLDELVSLARQVEDRERLAQAYFALMRYYIDTGQNQAALELVPMYAPVIAQGVAPATAIGFHQRVGFLYYRTGHLDRALEHHNEALRLARAADDVHQQAVVFNTRGTVLMCLGRYQGAISDFTHAADLWNTPAKRLFRAFALDNRGDVLYYLGCYEDNLRAKEDALPLYREFAYPIAEAECLSDTGACLQAMGRTAEAEAHLQAALALSQSLQDSYDLVQSLNGLARLHLEQGDQAGCRLAENCAGRAVTEAQQADLPHGIVQGLAYQAMAYLRQGRFQASLELSSQAVAQLKDRGYIEGAEEEIHFIHSQVLAANGQRTAAQEALQQAYDEMMIKASRLTDPELQRSFLEQVWLNRAIKAAMAGFDA